MTTAAQWLDRIRALPRRGRVKIMNVCGGHERSITLAGLRKALPDDIELVLLGAAWLGRARIIDNLLVTASP